jgi:hypothetical protein
MSTGASIRFATQPPDFEMKRAEYNQDETKIIRSSGENPEQAK